jgi:lambda family phage tail tape measure protein
VISVGAVAQLAKQALQTADAYTNMSARLSLVTKSVRELTNAQEALFSVAQRTRIDLEETTTLYTRLATSTEALGVSQGELVGVTEAINKALVISGSSAASAQAALVQLGQAFASGVLRGEELNSVLEQAPRLARAIADGLGVPIGKLRQMGADGEITAEKLFRALQNSSAALTAEFEKMPITVGGATTQVINSITALIGTIDKLTGSSSTVGGWVSQTSKDFDRLNDNIKRSGSVMQGIINTAKTTLAQTGLSDIQKQIEVAAVSAKRAQQILDSQPDSIYAKNTLRSFDELKQKAAAYEKQLKELRDLDVRTGTGPQAGGGRGFINPTGAVVAAQAKEAAALDARKAFLKEYATAEEKFTAELKKQKAAQGDLFTDADEKRLRDKFFPKKGKELDFVKGDVGTVERGLEQLTSVYANAERVLDATRNAGLISERAYYNEKLIFLELNTSAQVKALEAENAAIEARARKGQKGLDDDRKVADNLAQITILQERAGATAKVMGIEQDAAARKITQAYTEARIAATQYLDTIARQNALELTVMGQGEKAARRARERADIENKYQGQIDEAMGERRRNEITGQQLQQRLSIIADTQAKELALWEKHSEQIDAAQGNWVNGATSAMQNYIDAAENVAAQTEAAFSRGFRGMEDALVNFVMTGKGNFKDLAKSIIADLLRIQYQAAISGILKMISGTGSSASAGGDAALLADMGVGRAIGGPVSAGSMYEVNERGPELLNVGNKQYLMTGNQGGSVSPGGIGGDNITINVPAGATRNEVMTAIQLAMQTMRAETDQKLRKNGLRT